MPQAVCVSFWKAICYFDPQVTRKKKNPQYAKWILSTELDLAPLSQSHSEFSFVFTEALLWHDKQTPHTHNRDKDGARKRDLGAVTDNIFTEELQGAKILSTESVVLIVHWLILHLKGPQGFLTELTFATQLHPYYRSGGGACSINSSCSRSSSGGRGDSSSFSGSSNNCSLSLSVTPSMSETGAAVVEVIDRCTGDIYARQRDIDVYNFCSMGAQLPYPSLIIYWSAYIDGLSRSVWIGKLSALFSSGHWWHIEPVEHRLLKVFFCAVSWPRQEAWWRSQCKRQQYDMRPVLINVLERLWL